MVYYIRKLYDHSVASLIFFLQVTNDVITIPSDESSVESECLSDTDVRLNDKIKKSSRKKGKTGHL